jgi:heme A synthase
MRVATLFRLTSLAALVQIALGGLLTFGFVDPLPHIIMGTVLLVVAIVTVITALRARPPDRQLKQVSFALVGALVVQVVLGFTTLALGSDILAWIHLVLGVLIYAMALTGMSFAARQEYVSTGMREKEADPRV